ncbi:MAG TPA: AI-2E family transporter [Terriglobales bacterium]|nr:AI-2E family transporter [Terriglobales bacterium]
MPDEYERSRHELLEPPARNPVAVEQTPLERDDVQRTALVILSVAAVLTICYFAKLLLITIFVSVLLTFVLTPVVEFFERFRIPHAVGALVAVLLVLAALYGLTYLSYHKAVDFVHELPKYSDKIRSNVMRFQERAHEIQRTTQAVLPDTPEEKASVRVTQQTSWAETLTRGAGAVWEALLTVSFIPFLTYFMLTWQEHTRAATVMLFKMEHRNTAYVTLGRISKMIRSFILGNLVIGLFMSVVSLVVFAVIGLPYFYFLGVISGFLSLVPYLGVPLAMVPPLVAGLGQLSGAKIAAIMGTVLALHLFAINVLYPKLIGRRLQLNPLVVTISLLIWGWIWGAMGLILAVPLTAALKIILDHVESMRPYGTWLGE